MPINDDDIEGADIDRSSKTLFMALLARVKALEAAPQKDPEVTAMIYEMTDELGGKTTARYEKV